VAASSSALNNSTGSNSGGGGSANSSRIQVAVRIRPLSEREALNGESSVWRTSPRPLPGTVKEPSPGSATMEEVGDSIGKQYRFDYLCPADETTTELYKALVRKVVLKACIGCQCHSEAQLMRTSQHGCFLLS
jgi:hypothetical protein